MCPSDVPEMLKPASAGEARRRAFRARAAAAGLLPSWEWRQAPRPSEPQASTAPQLWRWSHMRRLALEAGEIITAKAAERRVLSLLGSGQSGVSPRVTPTLFAGIQALMPGETAPAHRHSASALHFVLESTGGYGRVEGERVAMRPGDLVVGPPWLLHAHGNEGSTPAIWLDVLDTPLVRFFDAAFFQSGDATDRMPGSASRAGAALHYPYDDMRAALLAAAGDDADGIPEPVALRYGAAGDGWLLPTIAAWMLHLPAGSGTAPRRSTDGIIVVVAEGKATAMIGGQSVALAPRDVLVVPNWCWRSFRAEEDGGCFLFCCSDRAAQEKLGLWREERRPPQASQ